MGMVLTEMAQVVYQLSPEMASKAEGWFTAHGWQVHRTRIAPSGQCQHCGGQLLSVHAAASSVRRIKLMMERLMLEDLDGKSRSHELLHNTNIFRHGTPQGLRGAHLLNKFKVWLQQHGAYDLIIDGANLGFSKANAKQKVRNAAKGLKINFAVMDDVIQELRTMVQSHGHRGRALVVLHAQHVRENKLTPHDKAIVERWQAEDALYITPFGMNDDWFWLYAALEASEASRHTLLLTQVTASPETSRWRQFTSLASALDAFITMFEIQYKKMNPTLVRLQYTAKDLNAYVDSLHDVSVMIVNTQHQMYQPRGRDFFKSELTNRLIAMSAKK